MSEPVCESDEERELMGLWLSRLMFGWMVGMPEQRSYEEWRAARVWGRRNADRTVCCNKQA